MAPIVNSDLAPEATPDTLDSLIERGRSRAANVIDYVMRHQPTDRLVRGEALQFRAAESLPEILITVPASGQEKIDLTLHSNAIYQRAQTTDMPVKFLDSLAASCWPSSDDGSMQENRPVHVRTCLKLGWRNEFLALPLPLYSLASDICCIT
jgi:hypothetical protein